MANINIQQAPDVVLEEPGSVFKGLAGTVLQGVISDIFYQAKQDRRTQQASLWEGYKLHGELGVKLADPILVEEGIAKIDLKLSDARTSNADKQQLSVLRDSFELQLKDLKKKEPTKDVASSVAGFQDLFNNAKGGGSPEFIGDAINDMQHEYDRLIEQSPPIDDSIIKQFKYNFKNIDVHKPDICNGLDKCKIYILCPLTTND